MRTAALLTFAAAVACTARPEPVGDQLAAAVAATPGPLRRTSAPRTTAEALAAVLAHDPRIVGQDPHIDQRRDGPRSFRSPWQPLVVGLQYGAGTVQVKAPGTVLHDRAAANFLRGVVDNGLGAGLALDVFASDASLFHGARINDGQVPAPADAACAGFDVFPHQRFDFAGGAFAMPLRIGLFGDWQRIDHTVAQVQREFLGVGPRLQCEPTWRWWSRGGDGVEWFARLGGDVGAAWFSENFHGGHDRATTWLAAADAATGVRGRVGTFFAELGCRWQHTWIGATDTDLYGDRSRTDLQREQVFLGFSLTY